MPGRLTLLIGSPRVAPGLLTRSAWQALDAAETVLAGDADEPLALAIAESGMPVAHLGAVPPPVLARDLVARAAGAAGAAGTAGTAGGAGPVGATGTAGAGGATVVWVGSADGDPGLTDAIASEVSRLPEPPEVEVLVGSWDVPGARLLDVVAVMDRLRSPGGCPWDAEQTHESLQKYLIEEAHEAAEAIESGDRAHLREELGDVLLQVAFQARVAQEHVSEPFDIDDVAGTLVDKLVRRHPHVFSDGDASTPAEVEQAWEQIKAQERAAKADHPGGEAGHPGLLHGIPRSLPSLLAAEKVLARWDRSGGDLAEVVGDDEDLGLSIVALVARARERGESAETLVREALARLDETRQDPQTGWAGRSGR